jgi:hypothetical protein
LKSVAELQAPSWNIWKNHNPDRKPSPSFVRIKSASRILEKSSEQNKRESHDIGETPRAAWQAVFRLA